MKLKPYELQVHGLNELKKVGKAEIENVIPQLSQYLGKQILTQTGLSKRFVVNFVELKPNPLPEGFAANHHAYIKVEYKSVKLYVKLCFNGGKYDDRTYYCQYFDDVYYLGETDERGVLTVVESAKEVIEGRKLNDVINYDEQLKLIEEYKAMESKLSDLKHKIRIEFR
jgi:hypothetical protein